MSDRQQQQKLIEVAQLTGLLCDGQISAAEMERLDRLLADDPAARARYCEYVSLEVALEWTMEGGESAASGPVSSSVGPMIGSVTGPVTGTSAAARRAKRHRPHVLGFLHRANKAMRAKYGGFRVNVRLALGLSLLFCAVIAGTAAIISAIVPKRALHADQPEAAESGERGARSVEAASPHEPAPAARLVRAVKVLWSEGLEPPAIGGNLAAGRKLHLDSGLVEIGCPRGVVLVLQGPASLIVESDRSVFLAEGRLTARLTRPEARGFTVRTPKSVAIDEGTEFGIDVQPGGDENIHVFQGKVRFAVNSKVGPGLAARELIANQGARLNAETDGVDLLADTGESFTRSLKNSDKDPHTVAYWRFEDGAVGTLVPNNNQEQQHVRATADCSGNGNDLFIWDLVRASRFSADVPAATVAQTGRANLGSLDNSVARNLRQGIPNLYTNSRFSHVSPIDVEKIVPAQWTIEASVKPVKLGDQPQVFVGRDGGTFVGAQKKQLPARFAFSINPAARFAVHFIDVKRRDWEAVAEQLQVKENHWYHVAAVSDGRALRLYADSLDGRGYQLRATTALATSGGTALGVGTATAHWTIGRGRDTDGRMACWFQGLIDEVRISDVARSPDEFLFAKQANLSQKVSQ